MGEDYTMKIAVFGGAFNPPHNEHINMCLSLISNGFDRVLLVPSNNPPHKSCDIDFDLRCDMVQLAIENYPNLQLCPIEGITNNVHYSYKTIEQIIKIYGEITFVIGGDSLIDFEKWKNPESIIEQCSLAVFNRAGYNKKFDKALQYWTKKGAKIQIIDYMPTDISSTIIRYNAMCGCFDGVCDSVAEYIKSNNIYNEYSSIVDKLKKTISQATFEHSLRTFGTAITINLHHKLGLDNDEVFLAGMFHDCAKNVNYDNKFSLEIPQDCLNTPVEHQFVGSLAVSKIYGINNQNIIQAIKSHTTGVPNMTVLQKLIYCADMLEDSRDFDGVEDLRILIMKDFEKGFVACIECAYEFLKNKNTNIYPLTTQAVSFYKEKKDDRTTSKKYM